MYRLGVIVATLSVIGWLLFAPSSVSHAGSALKRAFVQGHFECDVSFEDWGEDITLEQCVLSDIEFD